MKPLKSLWEIGFIQGMADAKAELDELEKTAERVKTKNWPAFRGHFRTILSLPSTQSLIYRIHAVLTPDVCPQGIYCPTKT
ncbi:MAG: hypothetical protein ABSG73_04090 [Candidatus Aminicenantales bacterium]|jgi:hypothetical protein